MKMRMTCLALLLCLLLTACGGKEPDSQGRTSFLGEAAGLEEDTVLLTVDGREVPAWRYLYWLAWTCQQMRERYAASGTALDWDTPGSGGTLAQYVKDQALADTVLYAVVENLAEKAGYASSEEVGAKAALPDMGLDEAQMAQLEDVGRMYGWLILTILSGTECTLFSYMYFCCSITLSITASRLACLGVSLHPASRRTSMYFLSLRIYWSCCLIALRIFLTVRFLHLARFR